MELVKSKGLAIFLIVVIGLNLINSISSKKYYEKRNIKDNYISMNVK